MGAGGAEGGNAMSIPEEMIGNSVFTTTPCRGLSRSRWLGGVLRDQTRRELVYRPLQFQKRGQLFIRTHDESLSVAMRVNNPNRSPLRI